MLIATGTRDAGNGRSVWAISDTGTLLWSYDTGGNTFDCYVDNDTHVYVVGARAGNKNIWKLNMEGSLIASVDIATSASFTYSVTVDDNYVYVGAATGCWRYNKGLSSGTEFLTVNAAYSSIAVDASGNIFCGRGGAGDDYLKYGSDLAYDWSKDVGATSIYGTVTKADGTNIFIGGSGADITSYTVDGALNWTDNTSYGFAGGNGSRPIAISSDETKIHVVGIIKTATYKYAILNVSDGSLNTAGPAYDANFLYGVCLDSSSNAYVCGVNAGSYSIWKVNGTSLTGLYNPGVDLSTITWSSVTPRDVNYTCKAVAIGNHEVWYEASAGVMTEVTDANADINSTNPLDAAEAFQKLFIANKGNLRVLDLINTKITTADAGLKPCTKGMVLTGATSGATMIVDYANAVTDDAAATVYGYKYSSAAFDNGETVSGTNGNGDTVSFVLNTAEDAPPHWYNWTVFGNDTTTYGSMPSKATIVCRYRGRLVLAGHPDYPHQWWMSKVADPWDWLYTSNDPMSAVSGQDADAGEIGDIITALIPYGDDYLIMGGSRSIHMVTGDPAAGGRIDEMSNNTGIYSQTAWCKDHNDNLYFFGAQGLYKMEGGNSKPVNLSIGVLPKWIEDWAIDKTGTRVKLMYDPEREGIVITKIDTDDDSNSSYWFSLKTQGFYPETYPEQNSPYSGLYYDSLTSTYRHLMIGCADGYIRYFKDTLKSDEIGGSYEAINSYVTLPTMQLGDGLDKEGKIDQIIMESAGGASGGDYTDTDAIDYFVYAADDAETLIEDIKDGATAALSVSISGTGRKARMRQRVRGMYGTIKLSNATLSSGWAINRIMYNNKLGGSL